MVQGCSSWKGVQLDQEPWDIDFLYFRLQTTLVASTSTGKMKHRVDKGKEQLEIQKELITKIYQS